MFVDPDFRNIPTPEESHVRVDEPSTFHPNGVKNPRHSILQTFNHSAVVALAWAIRYYAPLLGVLVSGAVLTLILVVILQRPNIIPSPAVQSAAAA